MHPAAAIDPDQFLDLSRAEPFTREEGRAAWEQAYSALEQALSLRGPRARLFIVFGLQAAGKSTWVESQLPAASDECVFFSGPLPSAAHRRRALELGNRFGAKTIAVWVKVPLHAALARNARRAGLARIPESVVQHVHESLEPPSLAEGFHEILVVEAPPDEAEPFARAGTSTGLALGPPAGVVHHPARGSSAIPASARQLKR